MMVALEEDKEPWAPVGGRSTLVPEHKHPERRAVSKEEYEEALDEFYYHNFENQKDRPIFYDCSSIGCYRAWLAWTEYGPRCARNIVTPVGNTLVCIHCCPEDDEVWEMSYLIYSKSTDDSNREAHQRRVEKYRKEIERYRNKQTMTAALQAKMRREWGLEEEASK